MKRVTDFIEKHSFEVAFIIGIIMFSYTLRSEVDSIKISFMFTTFCLIWGLTVYMLSKILFGGEKWMN